jgi:hypothetical protein
MAAKRGQFRQNLLKGCFLQRKEEGTATFQVYCLLLAVSPGQHPLAMGHVRGCLNPPAAPEQSSEEYPRTQKARNATGRRGMLTALLAGCDCTASLQQSPPPPPPPILINDDGCLGPRVQAIPPRPMEPPGNRCRLADFVCCDSRGAGCCPHGWADWKRQKTKGAQSAIIKIAADAIKLLSSVSGVIFNVSS